MFIISVILYRSVTGFCFDYFQDCATYILLWCILFTSFTCLLVYTCMLHLVLVSFLCLIKYDTPCIDFYWFEKTWFVVLLFCIGESSQDKEFNSYTVWGTLSATCKRIREQTFTCRLIWGIVWNCWPERYFISKLKLASSATHRCSVALSLALDCR